MTSLANRLNSALLVIDVQAGVVEDAYERDAVIKHINIAVDRARQNNVPVIWVQHSDQGMPIDSPEWQIVPELNPLEGDPHIRKEFRSSFEQTNLEQTLAELNVGHLYITGAQTNNCIRHTIHSALERGYDVTLVEDAHTTSDFNWDHGQITAEQMIDEQNANFHHYSLPNRTAVLATSSALFT